MIPARTANTIAHPADRRERRSRRGDHCISITTRIRCRHFTTASLSERKTPQRRRGGSKPLVEQARESGEGFVDVEGETEAAARFQ